MEASDVHVLGSSEAIVAVEDLGVLSNGTVRVLNSIEPFFVGFDADGNTLQPHGRRGGGPTEFEAPSGFVVGGVDGEAWVFDQRRHALIQVSRPDVDRTGCAGLGATMWPQHERAVKGERAHGHLGCRPGHRWT